MSRRAWSAFAVVSVLWGIPYLFIAVALRDGWSPWSLVCVRVAVAAVVLLAIAGREQVASARGRLAWLLAYALCEICVPFPLIAVGEQHVPSSVAAIVIASVPLLVTLVALRVDPSERPTRLRLAGMILGLVGVGALVGLDTSGRSGELLGVAALLVAALGYAVGPMILKLRLGDLDARVAMGVPLAMSAVLLAPAAVVAWPGRAVTPSGWGCMLVLALICTALAFVVFVTLLREAGTGRSSIVTYVNPVIALALGVTLNGERLRLGSLLGLVLILGGSWFATGGGLSWRVPRRGVAPVPAPVAAGPGTES